MTDPTDTAKLVDDGLWQCPDCAFAFDAAHEDSDGGHTCPCCAEARLTAALASANEMNERLVAQLRKLDEWRTKIDEDEDYTGWEDLESIVGEARALLASMKGDGGNG